MPFTTDMLDSLPAELRDHFRALQAQAVRDAEHIAQLQQRIDVLEEQFRLAQLKRFAPSSEKHGLQGCLFNEAETVAQAAQEGTDEQPNSADPADATPTPGKKRGRKKLPAHLKRVRVEHDLPDAERVCSCCCGELHRMGEDVTEQLHIVPAQVSVLQHVRFKYACRHCERHATSCQIVTSPMPAQPIPGSIASASTVATILTAKYADGLPLYRMESVLERSEVDIGRGTMGRWVIRSSEDWLARLVEMMRQTLLRQHVIHGDETPVQVLKEAGKTAQSTSYMWVYRSAEGSAQPVVLFDYQPGRGHAHPERFLQGYAGTLMTDGYAAWRMLKGVTHLGCLAHVRRKFDEALKAQKQPSGRAKQALDFIGKLYQIEKKARGKLPEDETPEQTTYRLRQEHSRGVLDAFYAWLVKNQEEVLPKSLIGRAIGYALGQWKYLVRYIDDGRAPVDNNVIERDIRPFTTGRKAWLFSDTVEGANASAIVYSIMLTCRACNIEPYSYLCHVLTEMPQRPIDADITDLLPFNYQPQAASAIE
jgi:transposase